MLDAAQGACGPASSSGPRPSKARAASHTLCPQPLWVPCLSHSRCAVCWGHWPAQLRGDCDMSLTVPSLRVREECEAETPSDIVLTAFASVPSSDHYKSPGNWAGNNSHPSSQRRKLKQGEVKCVCKVAHWAMARISEQTAGAVKSYKNKML